MITFNAIDVETANADQSSICQIGIVHVSNGEILHQWETLVDPETEFNQFNKDLHGIDSITVEESPTLPDFFDELADLLDDSVLISHTSFDRVAIEKASKKYNLQSLNVSWLDSVKIARRAWPNRYGGYSLKSLADEFGILFNHHSAVEDARAAAEIVLRAYNKLGFDQLVKSG